jgi:thymidylate synthase
MQISDRILDDLLRKVFQRLLASKHQITASRPGTARELIGVLLKLERPRARLSRSETRGRAFSCLGEFLWYLSGDNQLDFIRYYIKDYEKESDDGKTVYGGYGPRIFCQRGHNQLENVIKLLSKQPTSRRAVIQLFDAEDIAGKVRRTDIPCTCTLQFMLREDKLHLIASMRSNDAYKGLPHDIFAFTMLQEVAARMLGVDVGPYRQFVGNLHLYDYNEIAAQQYIDEGFQATVAMPAMPACDPWPSIQAVLAAEARIRAGERLDADACGVGDYWADLIRLLQIFSAKDPKTIEALKAKMVFGGYASYIQAIRQRRSRPKKNGAPPTETSTEPVIVEGV